MKKLCAFVLLAFVASSQAATLVTISNTTSCSFEIVLRYDVACYGNNYIFATGVYVTPNNRATYTLPSWVNGTGTCGDTMNLKICYYPVGTVPASNPSINLLVNSDCSVSTNSGCTPELVTYGWNIVNNNPQQALYQVSNSGGPLCNAYVSVPAGGSSPLTFSVTKMCDGTYQDGTGATVNPLAYQLTMWTAPANPTLNSVGSCLYWSGGGGQLVGGQPQLNPGGGGGTNTITSNTNVINGNTNLFNGSTNYAGVLSALYDVDRQGFAAVNGNLNLIQGKQDAANALLTAINNKSFGSTNPVSVSVSNYLSGGFDTNGINSFHTDNTNLLGKIAGMLAGQTNSGATNGAGWSPASGTNAAAALSASGTAAQPAIDALQGLSLIHI